jgi:hypothetical protein
MITGEVLARFGWELELRRAWLVRQLFASTAVRLRPIRYGFELSLPLDPFAPAIGSSSGPAPGGLVVPTEFRYVRLDGVAFGPVANADELRFTGR